MPITEGQIILASHGSCEWVSWDSHTYNYLAKGSEYFLPNAGPRNAGSKLKILRGELLLS